MQLLFNEVIKNGTMAQCLLNLTVRVHLYKILLVKHDYKVNASTTG